MDKIESLHGDSYERFWKERFPELWKDFLEGLIAKQSDLLDFGGPLEPVKVQVSGALDKTDPVSYCLERSIDLTWDLSAVIRPPYGALHTIHLGRIPGQTGQGSFVLNGKERYPMAQLVMSPGLLFSKEDVIRKHKCGDEYFDVRWQIFKGELIPSDGIWMEFQMLKIDPNQNLSLIPPDCRERIEAGNGSGTVKIRRKNRFPLDALLYALEMKNAPPPDSEDDEGYALPGEQAEIHYGHTRHKWREIAECLKISTGHRPDKDIRSDIGKYLLTENRLSPLARHQINRRLGRLNITGSNADHVQTQDIQGILDYLQALYDGKPFPLDSRRSLANKRVRLVGDLMEEEAVPRIFRKIRRRFKNRIMEAARFGDTIGEEVWAGILQEECLSGEKFLQSIKQFLFDSQLSALASGENALETTAFLRRITLFGPRGLPSTHVKDVRDIHWTHYGRLCPVDTPQSERLGATLSVPLEAGINEFGLLETPVYELIQRDGTTLVSTSFRWLSAADEEDGPCWIAYHDQIPALEKGQRVWARKGSDELKQVNASEVRYVDAAPLQQFSLAARLIPFVQHDDANRVLMACSAMRQALPLVEAEPPLIGTGHEAHLADPDGKPWAFGRNLLVAYMPYRGLNFEDAVVVSESAARKLRIVRRYEYDMGLREYGVYEDAANPKDEKKKKKKRKVVRWQPTRDISGSDAAKGKLDPYGMGKVGAWVEPGDILVGVVDTHQRQRTSIKTLAVRVMEGKASAPWDHSLRVPMGERGKIAQVTVFSKENGDVLPKGIWRLIRFTVEREQPLEVGDKLCNRHGGKGVVSAILPDEDMPRFEDPLSEHAHQDTPPHTHVEVILNPLGVISRLNLGQLYETHMGWIAKRTGAQLVTVAPFSNSLEFLEGENQKVLENPAVQGKVSLYDPLAKKPVERPVTAGYAYMLRLHHLAGEKVHGRGYQRFKYNSVSEQPLQGKKKGGGQRLGEMEIWGLEAYNARHIIQEVLTLKSDNPWMREWLYQAQKDAALPKNVNAEPPEMLRVLTLFLMAMGLKLEFKDAKGTALALFGPQRVAAPGKIHSVRILPLEDHDVKTLAAGEVTEHAMGTELEGYNDKGLHSQPVFGPLVDWVCKCGALHTVGWSYSRGTLQTTPTEGIERCRKCGVEIAKREIRRHRMGYIELAYPVFNVVFLDVASRLLGLSRVRMKDLLKEETEAPILQFQYSLDFSLFMWLAMNGSPELKGRVEKRLQTPFTEDQLSFQGFQSTLPPKFGNHLNAFPAKELQEGLSAIGLLNEILTAVTPERLEVMKKQLVNELTQLRKYNINETRRKQLINRLDVIDLFLNSGVPPSAMMMRNLPVLPPDLRRPYGLSMAREVRGELNELYQQVLFVNAGIKKGKRKDRAKKENIRILQQRVSALMDNDRAWPPSRNNATGKRYQQSLAYFIKGKKGFFRANLLGKRVDYSGRAVIVPDTSLELNQCGLPYAMAVEIFMPLLVKELRSRWKPMGKKRQKAYASDRGIENRIRRTLRSAKASSEYPNAATDSDADKKDLIRILNRIGADHPILLNRQPTLHRLGIQAFFFKINEHSAVCMHPLVTGGFNADFDGDTIAVHRLVSKNARKEAERLMATENLFSPANGSLTLNLGQDVSLGGYLQTQTEEGLGALLKQTGFPVKCPPLDGKALRSHLKSALSSDDDKNRRSRAVEGIKDLCFEKATASGITLSIFDMPDLSAERENVKTEKDPATAMDNRVAHALKNDRGNALSLIHRSGARGDIRTIRQLIAMRGEMERITEEGDQVAGSMVWSSLREGMTLGEYFVSAYGSRTTLVDKKMGTADAGYVTRQLVEMTQQIQITGQDCGDEDSGGMEIGPYRYVWLDARDWTQDALIGKLKEKTVVKLMWDTKNQQDGEPFKLEDIQKMPMSSIKESIAQMNLRIQIAGVKIKEKRTLRELLGKLYGRTLMSQVKIDGAILPRGFVVNEERIALQLARQVLQRQKTFRIRSPLTCRTPHGICRKCYGLDLATGKPPELGAKVGIIAAQSIGEPGTQLVLRTFHSGGIVGMSGISRDIPRVQRFLNTSDLAQVEAVERGLSTDTYPLLLDGIKEIYRANGITVADPHFEILLRAMLGKVGVDFFPGNRIFPGKVLEKSFFDAMNEPGAVVHPTLCGINQFSKNPAGWLASASFGATLTALAHAAAEGREDRLVGLKENVILGKLLP